ncbi:MAG: DUF4399 domain-containing protein [Bacteroidia bacterium]|nr:DUF4399 domain-containing protein [Bacteroidia bacterium]
MKNFTRTATAVFVTAVFFSCGGKNSSSESSDSTSVHHDHGAPITDTAIINTGQGVSFANLKNGETVSSPFVVKFDIAGMEVEPIDSGVRANKGHHHLLIDTLNFVPAGAVVPMIDNRALHFGKGQTETKPLTLAPGKHTLTMQFGDGLHRSYGVRMSKTITITVK